MQTTVLVKIILQTIVGFYVFFQRILAVTLPVLSQGITLEVIAQEQAAHVGVPEEHYAKEVVNLAL